MAVSKGLRVAAMAMPEVSFRLLVAPAATARGTKGGP